jgi:hypothetical protein
MAIFPSSCEGRETRTVLGFSERANLNHWTQANDQRVSLHSPEEPNISSFRNGIFYNYLEFWTIDMVQKRSDSECYTSSPELHSFYWRIAMRIFMNFPIAENAITDRYGITVSLRYNCQIFQEIIQQCQMCGAGNYIRDMKGCDRLSD